MRVCCSFALAVALGLCCGAHAYDIHLKSLTPVKELAKPAGGAMKFVENGELKFCVALDPGAETRAKNRTKKSIAPALVHLTNAIFRTTGKVPEVVLAPGPGWPAHRSLALVTTLLGMTATCSVFPLRG